MGPNGKYRGIGSGAAGIVNAPPTAPGNGSGGAGALGSVPGASAARGEIDDLLAGRLTLSGVGIVVIALVAFYVWTRSAQGGG
jgi:hypothetical protein